MKNREIKFRAWDRKGRQWLKPTFGGEICVGEDIVIVRNFQPNRRGGYSLSHEDTYTKDKIEIMQYTGIHDKNGKEIYEGDILLTEAWGEKIVIENITDCVRVIKFSDEIIGNIYQNKDLLK